METFLGWLLTNSLATAVIIIAVVVLFIFLIVMFIIAFVQGRDISFGPIKIGSNPDKTKSKKEKLNSNKFQKKSLSNSLFWDRLGNRVAIIFGAELDPELVKSGHVHLSSRDLNAAQLIASFLMRNYPEKKVKSIQVSSKDTQELFSDITSDEWDLILIGGFITNIEYTRHKSNLHNRWRLKMGRICQVADKESYHVEFHSYPLGMESPSYDLFKEVEDIPSEYVSVDYALVSSIREMVYGVERTVISIAGIKGPGTVGGAVHMTNTNNLNYLNSIIKINSSTEKSIELLIKTNVIGKTINKTKLLGVDIDGMLSFLEDSSNRLRKPCKIKPDCSSCTYGEPGSNTSPIINSDLQGKKVSYKYRIKAIIFDLDDTITDTYGTLIRKLETETANQIYKLMPDGPQPDELAAILLEIRRKRPESLEKEIHKRFPSISKDLFTIRDDILKNLILDKLSVRQDVLNLLEDLSKLFDLYLLTEGEETFQQAKLQKLELIKYFKGILIVTPIRFQSKYNAIKNILSDNKYDSKSVLIVGNRLDKEIRAGNNIGVPTLWVRYGEGSDMKPNDDTDRPDHIIDDVTEIWKILR